VGYWNVKSLDDCSKLAAKKKKKYFALQRNRECLADNSYGTPRKKYYQLDISKCIKKSYYHWEYSEKPVNSEHMLYCGGDWTSNATDIASNLIPNFQRKRKRELRLSVGFQKKRYKRALTNQWCDMYGGKDGFYWTLKKKTDNTVTAWEMLRGA